MAMKALKCKPHPTSYPGLLKPGEEKTRYTLFAHAR